ncbi:MAG: ABC transporter ATP-binding protein [Candidatus Rokubacteria bacterium]|nr:ABC transporter ATP-binding protein [Candidatus Rokubacteria bacterium]
MLEVRQVSAGYGRLTVLNGVSLRVDAGEIVALLGSNGAGKSTLLKVVTGLLPPRAGTVVFQDTELQRRPPHKIAEAGVVLVPEGRRLFPSMTVLENLLVGNSTQRSRPRRAQLLERVFDVFPVLAKRRSQLAGTLSGGEQQMAAVGRALMGDPRLLVLDEPSLGLAPALTELLFDTFGALNRDGLTLLLVEQSVALALDLCHRAYVLENGTIALSGSGVDLRENDRIRELYLGM